MTPLLVSSFQGMLGKAVVFSTYMTVCRAIKYNLVFAFNGVRQACVTDPVLPIQLFHSHAKVVNSCVQAAT